MLIPGFMRPMMASQWNLRSSSPFQLGVIWAFMVMGIKMSGTWPTCSPVKPALLTPTTVSSVPLTVICRFKTEGSLPKRRVQ